jgi:hypothetical protein
MDPIRDFGEVVAVDGVMVTEALMLCSSDQMTMGERRSSTAADGELQPSAITRI